MIGRMISVIKLTSISPCPIRPLRKEASKQQAHFPLVVRKYYPYLQASRVL